MVGDRRIDEIIAVSCFPNGGGLKEREIREAGPSGIGCAGNNGSRLRPNCQHIRLQHGHHRPPAAGVLRRAEAGVQIYGVVLKEDAGVKLGRVSGFFTQPGAVWMVDIAIELIPARRGVADSHRDHRQPVQHIVEIVSSICAPGHVRRKKQHIAVLVGRIICPGVEYALIPPVGQIVHRSGPADIVIRAVRVAAKPVMGAKDIDAPVKYMGLSIGNILPGGQIGVESLFFHSCFLNKYDNFRSGPGTQKSTDSCHSTAALLCAEASPRTGAHIPPPRGHPLPGWRRHWWR